jgi:hypothetical protein
VLQGAQRLLQEKPPRAIVYEWPCTPSGEVIDHSAAELLERFGYRVEHIPRPSGEINERENYLAVHSSVLAPSKAAAVPSAQSRVETKA